MRFLGFCRFAGVGMRLLRNLPRLGATLGGTLGGTLGSVEINFVVSSVLVDLRGKGAVENHSSSSGVQCAEEKTFFTCTSSSALQGRSHDGMQTEPSAT